MKSSSRYISIILIIALLFTIIPAPKTLAQQSTTSVLKIRGNVSLKKVGANFWTNIARKRVATSGDIVKTGDNSGARLNFSDGSVARLYEKSTLKITQAEFAPEKKVAKFKALLGKFKFKVTKLLGKESKFEVETPTAVASVRGTEFDMEVLGFESEPNAEKADIYTVTGIEIIPQVEEKEETLTPEEEASLAEEEAFLIEAPQPEKEAKKKIPVVKSLNPTTGDNSTDQTLTITGENFEHGAIVFLEDNPLEKVEVKNKGEIVAKVPANFPPGKYRVKVVNPDKTLVKTIKGTVILTSLITGAVMTLTGGSGVAVAGLGGLSAGGAVIGGAAGAAVAGGAGAGIAVAAIVGGAAAVAAAAGGGGGGGGGATPTPTPTPTGTITPTPTGTITPTPTEHALHITYPADGAVLSERIITMTGYSTNSNITDVVVVINNATGVQFNLSQGGFSGKISLFGGENNITVYGRNVQTQVLDTVTLTVTLNQTVAAMNIRLSWDTPVDMDLNLVTPAHKLINWAGKTDPASDGALDIDIQTGPGTENITFLNTPPEGPYWIAVNYFNPRGVVIDTPVTVEVFVRNPENGEAVKVGTYQHTFPSGDYFGAQLPVAAGQKPESVFVVGTINFPLPDPFPADPSTLLIEGQPPVDEFTHIPINNSESLSLKAMTNPYDITPPQIQVLFPKPGDFLVTTTTDIAGETEANAEVELIEPTTLKIRTCQADGTGYFFFERVQLNPGENVIKLKAIDQNGNEGAGEIKVIVKQ